MLKESVPAHTIPRQGVNTLYFTSHVRTRHLKRQALIDGSKENLCNAFQHLDITASPYHQQLFNLQEVLSPDHFTALVKHDLDFSPGYSYREQQLAHLPTTSSSITAAGTTDKIFAASLQH